MKLCSTDAESSSTYQTVQADIEARTALPLNSAGGYRPSQTQILHSTPRQQTTSPSF